MTMKRTPRPRDPIQLGKLMVDIATGAVPDSVEITALSERGKKGGMKGGVGRAVKLTPDQRSDIARMAADARWKKSN